MNKNKNYLLETASLIIIIILFFIGTILVFRTDIFDYRKSEPKAQPNITQPEIIKEEIEEIKIKELTDFEKFQSFRKISVYEDFITPATINQFCLDVERKDKECKEAIISLTNKLLIDGEIEDGYLYIKAGVSRSGEAMSQLTSYDSIYLYLNDSKNGGHLIRPKALSYRVTEDGLTELLYKLDNVSFTHLPYNENADPDKDKNPDLLSVLQSDNTHYLGAYVSTLGYGKIVDLVIGYKGGTIQVIK